MSISVLFVLILSMVLVIHITYPLLLNKLSKKNANLKSENKFTYSTSPSDLPNVSILIPVYNEERDIERRLNNLFNSDYPRNKLEIIVIDSGSVDKTRSIVQSHFGNGITLVTEEERKGKAHAINLGLQRCKGEIIILTDGTTLYDRETIRQLVDSFKDFRIGAASAVYEVPNRDESHLSDSEFKFWGHKDRIRLLESSTHSTSWLSGEACAFRSGIINNVDEDTLADDSNIALQVISKGFRVVVNQNAHFVEPSPTQVFDYFRIKSRRALGGLIETLRFKSLLFNRNYESFGTIIFPYRFFVYLISPILSCLLLVLAFLTTIELISYLGIYMTLLLGTTLIVIGVFLRDVIMTYLYTHLFTIIALIWLVSGNTDVRWTRSTTR
jgi:cellulose synthase/poly-beta-1,6-N-acetylglucosamine synthase-like glycosyltransferase